MEPVGKQRFPVAAATANDVPTAGSDMPFFIFIAGADAGAQESIVYCTDKRDWKNLLPDLMTKVADHALRSDVTDYIRLRAVCKPWRSNAKENPSLMGMDPRFFPRNWVMYPEGKLPREKTRFANGITGASIQLQFPPEYGKVITSAEGCLVLAVQQEMRLFNPVTRVVTELPCLFPHLGNDQMISCLSDAAGILYDGEADPTPTVVLLLPMLLGNWTVLMYAKPGDPEWRLGAGAVEEEEEDGLVMWAGGHSVRGRFYVPTCTGDLLRLELQQQPRLLYVARQEARHRCACFGAIYSLVPSFDDGNGGMLLVRTIASVGQDTSRAAFRVNIEEGSLTML